ncbi:hypothetical protein HELRODRAFT_159238 [Helobdella robusta]|uniref:PiggyBac transposable element-derived protein domain-containing protein n=1 Tax=Helobdella robusta TaxID=6412 RepID=T1ENS2_HELRO|nr:hypothetical protein HELRODRAFT_159238 [Helobdella robusta]ESO12661.1 hypothetical protein HELRODRAFT_159238 [Helobdella robusta]
MREGRHGDAPLSAKNNFPKNDRGKFEFTGDGSVVVVRWSDNSVVTCASNYDSVEPVKKVQRHVKDQRQRLGGHTASIPDYVRFDGSNHYLETVKQGRCTYCKSNTTRQYGKCNKRLHERCFVAYHQK